MTDLVALHLRKTYKGREVVSDLSLVVGPGEIVGLLGPNGAGKTTSFYMIVGLIKQDNGQIKVGNSDISQLPMHGRAKAGLGYLPQEASVFRKLTVAENLMAILELRDDLTKHERKLEGVGDISKACQSCLNWRPVIPVSIRPQGLQCLWV